MQEKETKTGKSNRKATIFIGACIVVVVACIVYICIYFFNGSNQKMDDKKLASEAYKVEKIETEVQTESEPEEVQIPIDFNMLWEQNQEIYAWISIPSLEIEYPLLQSATDDEYYLSRGLDGQELKAGCLFTQSMNSKDFTDFNTIIYGHNMKNGTMFGKLKKYRDEQFMKDNATVYIYTPDTIYTYEIFAAVTHSDEHILKSYDFEEETQREKFLESITSTKDLNSPVRSDVEVTADSRILTLSTCIGGQPNNRLLVEAVLVNEQK